MSLLIDRLLRVWTRPWVVACLAAVLFGLAVSGVASHRIHVDEAWIGEQSLMLARHGEVRTELFAGMTGSADGVQVYHRLFVWIGAAFSHLFGWGLVTLRSVAVLSAVALIVATVTTARRRDGSWSEPFLAVALLLLVAVAFEHVRTFRPEMLAAALGLASYLAMTRLRRPQVSAAVAGAIAGLAALSHLYALAYIAAGAVLLLAERRTRELPAYVGAAALALAPVAIALLSDWPLVQAELASPLNAGKGQVGFLDAAISALREHERLFRRPDIALASLMFVGALIVHVRSNVRPHRSLVVYTLALIVSVGALSVDKVETRYGLLVLPMFCILISWAVHEVRGRSSLQPAIAALLLVAVTAHGLTSAVTCVLTHGEDAVQQHRRIAARLPEGSTVLAPMTFLFGSADRVHVVALRRVAADDGDRVRAGTLARVAESVGADYLIAMSDAPIEERVPPDLRATWRGPRLTLVERTRAADVWRFGDASMTREVVP